MSTAFVVKSQENIWVCKNQDVIYDEVYLFTNQRNLHKTALIMPPSIPASWTSKYGSLTVSQVGKENPNGGINEAGLVIEQTTLWATQYPADNGLPVLSELQWIQYLLDTCSTVGEALEAARKIRIDQSTSQLHYLLADRTGNYAIVEFLHGQMCVHAMPLEAPVITNSAYSDAIREFKSGKRSWSHWDEYEKNSMDRFLCIAGAYAQSDMYLDHPGALFKLLVSAKRKDTVFSLVYDLQQMELHVTTSKHKEGVLIRMTDFDFSNASHAQVTNLQCRLGEQEELLFEDYSADINKEVVRSFFRDPLLTSVFQWEIPDELIHYIAHYPDSYTTCTVNGEQ